LNQKKELKSNYDSRYSNPDYSENKTVSLVK